MPKSLALRIVQSDDESMGRLQPGWLAQQVGLQYVDCLKRLKFAEMAWLLSEE